MQLAKYNYGNDHLIDLTHAIEGRRFYHFDALGTVTNLTDMAGNPVASYHLDAWGIYRFPDELNVSQNRMGFTGHTYDKETDLIFAKSRFYSPTIGRFLSQDIFRQNVADPPTLHRYVYVRNSPTGYTDPSGHYEADFHKGMTEYLAKVAGFSNREARLLGKYAENPDQDEREPVMNGETVMVAPLIFPNSDEIRDQSAMRLRNSHFPLSKLDSETLVISVGENGHLLQGEVVPDLGVVPGSPEASAMANEGIAKDYLLIFGEGLHVYEDSWSHRGTGAFQYSVVTKPNYAVFGHPPDRGGFSSHATDQTFNYPEVAMDAATHVFMKMLEYQQKNRGMTAAELEQRIRDFQERIVEMDEFMRLDTKQAKIKWLKEHNIDLRKEDVDDLSLPETPEAPLLIIVDEDTSQDYTPYNPSNRLNLLRG